MRQVRNRGTGNNQRTIQPYQTFLIGCCVNGPHDHISFPFPRLLLRDNRFGLTLSPRLLRGEMYFPDIPASRFLRAEPRGFAGRTDFDPDRCAAGLATVLPNRVRPLVTTLARFSDSKL